MTKKNLNATTAQTTRTTRMMTRERMDITINNNNNSNINSNNKMIPERNHSTDNKDNQDDDQGEDGQHHQQGRVKSTVLHLAVSLRIA